MKNIVGITLFVGGLFLWLKGKKDELSESFTQTVQQLQYKVLNIKNVDIEGNFIDLISGRATIKFDLDLEISNPTMHNWNVSGAGMVSLSKLEFLNIQEQVIATAFPELEKVNLPSEGKAVFKNIKSEIPSNKLPAILGNIQNFTKDSFDLRPTLNIGGTEYTLTN